VKAKCGTKPCGLKMGHAGDEHYPRPEQERQVFQTRFTLYGIFIASDQSRHLDELCRRHAQWDLRDCPAIDPMRTCIALSPECPGLLLYLGQHASNDWTARYFATLDLVMKTAPDKSPGRFIDRLLQTMMICAL
jgi:hypothetical protein